ncbi:F-box domain-containing protein [Mycena sanguinolenta]|uniref:F-box domain-containing protein n=1 Tax=Mycena sanguinolenta TaxID=230812 RepID=A0A8H6XTH6_9AGAR|nr:F-box domain-containing protein [Mycena sanguinolenta]
MPGAMVIIPHEVWLRIFELVDSTAALRCVVLACRKFYNLGTEALVRHISWRSTEIAMNHLDFWERNPSKAYFVRSVYFALSPNNESADNYPRIFGCIQSFSRLEHMKLAFGSLPDVLYPTLQRLPSLTHLELQSCVIPPLPPFYPYSFPSTDTPEPIQLTKLTLSKMRCFTVSFASYLPNLSAFETDSIGIQLPVDISAQLSSLSLTLHGAIGDIQPRLDVVLLRMPALVHLDVSIATFGHQAQQTTATVSQHPSPILPMLRTLSAPWPVAGHLLPGAPALTHLRVASPIPKPSDAVWLLERLQGGGSPLRGVALYLHTWDDEVLLAAVRCLSDCEMLGIVYQRGGPSDEFLFDLGIQHLPLMNTLHTLRLFALPPVEPIRIPTPRFVWDANTGEASVMEDWFVDDDDNSTAASSDSDPEAAAAEAEAKKEEEAQEARVQTEKTVTLRECVHAWTRYNPLLKRVQLGREGEKRTWAKGKRLGDGRGWETDEDEDTDAVWPHSYAAAD